MLSSLKTGQRAKIVDIKLMHPATHKRLIDLDILEGTTVRVVRKFPFGGPISIEVNGQHIGLRKQDANGIEVVCL
jgi:ferrous iron transport protein A